MISTVSPDHPLQKLIFFIAQDVDDELRLKVKEFVDQLAGMRHWLNGPPQYLDETDDTPSSDPDDLPIESLGGYIEIFSAWPPWKVPYDVDLQHLREAEDLVEALCRFSRQNDLAIEMQLDQKFIGEIQNGEMDVLLAEVLLGEWRRKLKVGAGD
jgi:hypothetical protein